MASRPQIQTTTPTSQQQQQAQRLHSSLKLEPGDHPMDAASLQQQELIKLLAAHFQQQFYAQLTRTNQQFQLFHRHGNNHNSQQPTTDYLDNLNNLINATTATPTPPPPQQQQQSSTVKATNLQSNQRLTADANQAQLFNIQRYQQQQLSQNLLEPMQMATAAAQISYMTDASLFKANSLAGLYAAPQAASDALSPPLPAQRLNQANTLIEYQHRQQQRQAHNKRLDNNSNSRSKTDEENESEECGVNLKFGISTILGGKLNGQPATNYHVIASASDSKHDDNDSRYKDNEFEARAGYYDGENDDDDDDGVDDDDDIEPDVEDLGTAQSPADVDRHQQQTTAQVLSKFFNDRRLPPPCGNAGAASHQLNQIAQNNTAQQLAMNSAHQVNNLTQHQNNGRLPFIANQAAFPWTSTARGKPRRGMMRRAVFSDSQRVGLEKRFQMQKYISKPDRKKLAEKLGLRDSQVKIWFQNRRMKWRNSKERELLSAGGSREQTLPTRSNPNPDLSDVGATVKQRLQQQKQQQLLEQQQTKLDQTSPAAVVVVAATPT